ncbi:predicted protein [Histoplasma mississippiense (nom. inval.)]|uniref:predicted protein n=1 Tax=Ajellomyces capsulatus (strain NAm1 / WU24) TaxID=2059318 RepID=UPI000157CC4C|nr:predicted protein [Histoplasma mississippiense (nom. inval.)]EDN09889.1 predicted protein [Histoplasma mississippiense (nom. inval.)]
MYPEATSAGPYLRFHPSYNPVSVCTDIRYQTLAVHPDLNWQSGNSESVHNNYSFVT